MILFQIAAAGALGTAAMIGVMSLIHRMGWANADMVRAIGALYTRSLARAFYPGLLIHFSFGIFFAFLYALFAAHAPGGIGPAGIVILCGILGFAHGLWVGLALVVEVAEYHPLARFRDAGFEVAIAHCIGHVFYGLGVGALLAANWSTIGTAVAGWEAGPALADLIGYGMVWILLFGAPLGFLAYLSYSAYSGRKTTRP